MEILIFLLATFVGNTIQTVSGFGFGIFVMTIFPHILPQATCATLSGLLSMLGSVTLAIKLRKKAKWRTIAIPIAAYFVFSYLAISLGTELPNALLKRCLGVVLIALSLYFLFFSAKIKFKPTPTAGLIAGALGGILGGLFSTGGPPIVLYLLNTGDDNDTYIANTQSYFAVTNLYSAAVRAAKGLITTQVLGYWAIGIVAVFAGLFVGRALFRRIDAGLLKKIVYCYMAVSGVVMLV